MSPLQSSQSFKPLGFPLGVKARANKLNPPKTNQYCGFNIGIRLFFKFNIVASKEFRLTIVSSLEVRRDTLLLAAPIVLQRRRIGYRLSVS